MSSRIESTGRAWIAALGATFALAAGLRAYGLQSSLWHDEIVTLVLSARLPIAQIVTRFHDVNVHPLFSILAHASISTFGESAWALRLPACIFGVASVVMTYVLGLRLANRTEAWVAALVLATSYHHIWFSQNARGYTLLGFFTLVATLALLRACQSGLRRDYVLYVVACAAGVYTHLTMAFVVAGHVLVVLAGLALRWRAVRELSVASLSRAWLGVGVLSVLLYAPFATGMIAFLDNRAPREAAKVATASWALSETIRSFVSGAGVPVALATGLLACVGAFSLWRRQPLAAALMAMPAAVTAAAVVALNQPLRPRFFFFLSGAVAICVGHGIGRLAETLDARWRRSPGAGARPPSSGRLEAPVGAVVVLALALAAASTPALPRNYRLPKQDFDGAAAFLTKAEAEGWEVTAAGPACLPFEIYYAKEWRCLMTADDWTAASRSGRRVLVAHTLSEHVVDAALREYLRTRCPLVERFAGTLGGGDIVVCEVQGR